MNNEQEKLNNGDIEIDLREVYQELKKNVKLIAGVTCAFAAAAAVYSFAIAKPVYQYDRLIKLPINQGSWQVNTCVELLKNDTGKNNSLASVTLLKDSYILKLTFSGGDATVVKETADKYLPKAVNLVNGVLVDKQKADFENETVKSIKNNVSYITSKIVENSFTSNDTNESLKYLVKRIDESTKNKIFLKAEPVVDEQSTAVQVEPNRKRNIGLATVLGLFLSCGYVVGRYLFRKS